MSGPSAPVRSAVFTTATTDAYGSTQVLRRHALALVGSGARVAVVHGTGRGDVTVASSVLQSLVDDGVAVEPVDGLTFWPVLPPFRRVVGAVASFEPELLVSTQLRDAVSTAVLARRLGVPFVALVQNHPRFSGTAPAAWSKRRLYRQALVGADRVVCVADHVAAVAEHELGVDPTRIGVLPNVIEVGPPPAGDPAMSAAVRRSLGVDDDEFLVVNVGRFHHQKGQLELVEALALVEDRRVVVAFVGDVEATNSGDYLARLRERVTALGLEDRVRWAGFRTDVPDVLEAADLFVSSSRWEAGPSLAVLEAMAAQCPVVATDHGDRVAGFVDDTHGLYVPVADPAALARGITWMANRSNEERQTMGERARRLLEERQRRIDSGEDFVEQVRLALAGRRR